MKKPIAKPSKLAVILASVSAMFAGLQGMPNHAPRFKDVPKDVQERKLAEAEEERARKAAKRAGGKGQKL